MMTDEHAIARIQDREYILNQEMFNAMQFFVKNSVISGGSIKIFNIQNPDIVSPFYFEMILSILKNEDYKIGVPAKVKSNNPMDTFSDQPILAIFRKLSIEQIKKLYMAAHYLEVKNLRLCIAAYLASFVYVSEDSRSFNERRKALNIKVDLTNEDIKEYTERYCFMN